MTFPVLGGNGAVAGAFSIDNSLRLNDGDTPRLTRTPSSQGNPRTFTFSCWVKKSSNGIRQVLFGADIPSQANASYVRFTDDDTLQAYFDYGNNTLEANFNSVAKFRDVSAFYHVVWATDTSLSTEADRVKLYVNGVQITDFQSPDYISQNFGTDINQTHPHYVGTDTVGVGNDSSIDGYLAEVNFIDGQQLSPTDFGEFDEDSGIWKPKEYEGTYGTNGFYLDFENSGSLGADSSGNGNNFTPTNLASTDQTTDTPTNNFATLNSLDNYWANSTFSEGNCKMVTAGTGYGYPRSTMGISSGKWYFEAKASNLSGNLFVGIVSTTGTGTEQEVGNKSNDYGYKFTSGAIRENTVETSYGDSLGTSDILGVGIDLDNNKLYFSKNGTWQNSANPETNTGGFSITAPSSTLLGEYFASASDINSSNSSTVAFNFGNPAFSVSSGNSDGNGYGNFEYAPPSGYLALCTQNLATELSPTISDSSQYFNTAIWSGDGTDDRSITGVGFQPDTVWYKERNNAVSHRWVDAVRGIGKELYVDLSNAEFSASNELQAYESDGFQIGNDVSINASGDTYVGWCWKGSNTTASNTDGSITSTISANQTAGFSIVTYTGTGANATVGHGLGKKPDVIIIKDRDNAKSWVVYTSVLGATKSLNLNTSDAQATGITEFQSTEPTTSVFSLATDNNVNGSGQRYVAYCFNNVEGYSKFGSYTGNGSTDGTFIYTGFRPALVIVKKYSAGENWNMTDSTRSPFNVCQHGLSPSTSSAEDTTNGVRIDLLSNGFKPRDTAGQYNDSGASYIYMAFGHTFVDSNGNPNTAR